MCVPLKFGSGTRIKIIESLAVGTIVLSTKKVLKELKLKINHHLYYKIEKNLLQKY